jgi:hypothetical protein
MQTVIKEINSGTNSGYGSITTGILQMDAFVFREDELSDFLPKRSFNMNAMGMDLF